MVFATRLIARGTASPGGPHERHLRIVRQGAIAPKHTALTLASEVGSLRGFNNRVGAGLGVDLVDRGHLDTLNRTDVVTVPLTEDVRIATCVLHKH